MPKWKVIFLLSSVGLFLLFVLFSYLVQKQLFVPMDFDATVQLQDHLSRRVDNPFSYLSVIGSFEPMVIFLVVLLVLRRKIVAGIVTGMAFVSLHLFEIYGKTFVNHHPPPEFMLRTKKLIDVPQFHVREVFSYPSGHAGRAMFITLILGGIIWYSKKLNRTQKICLLSVLVGYDAVMFISRVYLGEHWTTDIIGGVFLGASLALASLVLLL